MTAPSIATPPLHRFFRPTWTEIDLKAFRGNLRRLRAVLARRTKLMLVVKANAYGHGAVAMSQEAQRTGLADWLGVSSVEEGISLREAGIRLPILILGSLYPFDSFLAAVRYGLTPTVASLEGAECLAEVARALGAAGSSRVRCHVKLDTGMGRIGVGWPSGLRLLQFIAEEDCLQLEGVYTHFASADGDAAYAKLQLRRFRAALTDIRRLGIDIPLAHAANSAATLRFPGSRFDLVRPGLAAYGLYGRGPKPVLSLKSRIVFIKNVQKGTPIGYGLMFRASRPSRIATLPIGYADGFSRALSNKADVLVRGRRCRVVGAVSMDMVTVDVSRVPDVHVGDEAVILGASGREVVEAGELARLAGTVSYEIVSGISARVPRLYLN